MSDRPRQGVQLCAPLDMGSLRKVLAEFGAVLVQPKLKGMHLHWDGETLLSAEGNPLPALAHIQAALAQDHPGLALEGEAYRHGLAEAEIIGRCHRQAPDEDTAAIQMHIFDIIDPTQNTAQRMRALERLRYVEPLREVLAKRADSLRKVRWMLAQAERRGFEGIVVRDPRALWQPGKNPGVWKWKPRQYDQYPVVEVIEGAPGEAGSLALADREGSVFTVGSLCLNKEQRKLLWERRDEALGHMAWVSYCGADEDGRDAARVDKIMGLDWLAVRPAMHFQIDLPESAY